MRCEASANSTSSSVITSRAGEDDFPVTTMASDPVFLSSVAMKLDESESPIIPVSGDFAATANLLEVVSLLPTSGLVAKIKGFSGDSGSRPGTPYL